MKNRREKRMEEKEKINYERIYRDTKHWNLLFSAKPASRYYFVCRSYANQYDMTVSGSLLGSLVYI